MRRKATWLVCRQSSTTPGYVVASIPSHLLFSSIVLVHHIESQLTDLSSRQGLVKSNNRNDQQTGVRLLSEIFRVSPERRRECLYYLALGNYKLGNYADARRYNDLLLDKEPMNMQAADLRRLVDDKVAKEGLMGVAIISGVAIAAGVVGGILFRGRRR